MAASLWLTLLVACIVISFTPGAGAINTMGNALNHGFRRAIWGILGQQAALIVHIAIVALGVGVLVASSPVLFNVICGANQARPTSPTSGCGCSCSARRLRRRAPRPGLRTMR